MARSSEFFECQAVDDDALTLDVAPEFGPAPAVRSDTVVDPIFGAVTFAAVLRTDDAVEIVRFRRRPGLLGGADDDPG